jgi:hypothetical protein
MRLLRRKRQEAVAPAPPPQPVIYGRPLRRGWEGLPRREGAVPPPVPPGIAVLSRGYDPPYGTAGEFTVARSDPPPQPPPRPTIPPPDWEAEAAQNGGNRQNTQPIEPGAAVAAMMAAAEPYDPPAPGPIEVSTPLARFVPPEPDWRREELERAEREKP